MRDATDADAAPIAVIYDHFVATSVITFEEEAVGPAAMAQRMAAVRAASLPWLVAVEGGVVRGYAYATRWKDRSAYRRSVEVTIYLAPDAGGRGLGRALYEELFARLRASGVHAVMAGIALPNDASVALHERLGMTKVAHFRETGFKHGRWVDVGYWQAILG